MTITEGFGLAVSVTGLARIIPLIKGKTYEAIQSVAGSPFDVVRLNLDGHVYDMWVDDEGLLKRLYINRFATQCHATRVGIEHACIVGDVLFTGGCDYEGETLPMSREELDYLVELYLSKSQEDFIGPHFSWKGVPLEEDE